ncbi:WGxxGxxG family protein [Mangrovibacillus sp. Mu-81]|jgi:MYXO-CTERM domain-containing protein|uniref:WGxxGxxG family protein n=1 Tax=Mangrovibacillus sp. Mu-81 TaxID=3121478 RepID=UPI002FE4F326
MTKKITMLTCSLLLLTMMFTSSIFAYNGNDQVNNDNLDNGIRNVATQNANDDDDTDWGWLGLIGLAGLLGLRRRDEK